MTNPADLTIPEAAAALRSGTLTARDLTQAHLDRIAARNAACTPSRISTLTLWPRPTARTNALPQVTPPPFAASPLPSRT